MSAVTYSEIQEAPDFVRQPIEDLPSGSCEEISIDQEIRSLATDYIAAGASAPTMETMPSCGRRTVAKADAFLSWNFQHIVNFDRILSSTA